MKRKLYASLLIITLISTAILVIWNIQNPVSSESLPKLPDDDSYATGGMAASMDFWYQSRAYPNEHIPDGKFAEAFNQHKKHSRSSGIRSAKDWEPMGPLNFGGRTLQLTFNPANPNTIYAGSASGGLWRSYTGGVGVHGWHRIETGFPAMSVPTVAVSPSDTNVIYIGTGEVYNYGYSGTGYAVWPTRGFYGIGILKSTDAGKTWSKSLDWSMDGMKGVWMIKINPLNHDILYAATTEGVYRSNDAGGNWNLIMNTKMAMDLVIHTTDTAVLLVSCGDMGSSGTGVYRSPNSGLNWVRISTSGGIPDYFGKTMLGICRDFPDNMYASVGYASNDIELYQSTDKGITWNPLISERYTYGWFAHDVAVNPQRPNHIVCAGQETYLYDPAGDSLVKKAFALKWFLTQTPIGGPEGPPDHMHGDIHDIVWHPTDTNIIYFATDGGIFRSMDGGETFSGHNGHYQTQQFYQGMSNSRTDSNFALAGLQDNCTAVYEGNMSYRRVIVGDGGYNVIDPNNDNITFSSTQWGKHYKSVDRADSFTRLDNLHFHIENCNFISPLIMDPNNSSILYAGKDTIYKSMNGGQAWSGISVLDNGKPAMAMAVSLVNSNVMYASSTPIYMGSNLSVIENRPARLMKSTNAGKNWTDVSGSLPDRIYTDIAIDPWNLETLYITLSGYGTEHVYRSRDGGQNWEAVFKGIPDVPVNAVFIDPFSPNHIYIGNDLGVYASQDWGDNWVPFSQKLPGAVMIYDLTVSVSNKKLRAATHGNGIYQTDLIPSTLTSIDPKTENRADISIYPNPSSSFVNISITDEMHKTVSVKLIDLNGRTIELKTVELNPGKNQTMRLDVNRLADGIYIVEINGEGIRYSEKITVQH